MDAKNIYSKEKSKETFQSVIKTDLPDESFANVKLDQCSNEKIRYALEHRWRADCAYLPFHYTEQSLG